MTADSLDAYYDEIRAIEDGWFAKYADKRVIGTSWWNRNLKLLREIDARHGVLPGDPRVYSIAAYRRDENEIEAEWEKLREVNGWDDPSPEQPYYRDYFNAELRFGARHSDCFARHFPGLEHLHDRTIDSARKLWAHIHEHMIRALENHSLVYTDKGKTVLCTAPEAVVRVFGHMHRLQIEGAPPQPYEALSEREAIDRLWNIANTLATDDARPRVWDEGIKKWMLASKTTGDSRLRSHPRSDNCMPLSRAELPQIVEAIRVFQNVLVAYPFPEPQDHDRTPVARARDELFKNLAPSGTRSDGEWPDIDNSDLDVSTRKTLRDICDLFCNPFNLTFFFLHGSHRDEMLCELSDAIASLTPGGPPHPDGPDEAGNLWKDNVCTPVEPRLRPLIKMTWGKSMVTWKELQAAGHYQDISHGTMRSYVGQATRVLSDAGFRIELSKRKSEIHVSAF
jgi:hypothetical protein